MLVSARSDEQSLIKIPRPKRADVGSWHSGSIESKERISAVAKMFNDDGVVRRCASSPKKQFKASQLKRKILDTDLPVLPVPPLQRSKVTRPAAHASLTENQNIPVIDGATYNDSFAADGGATGYVTSDLEVVLQEVTDNFSALQGQLTLPGEITFHL